MVLCLHRSSTSWMRLVSFAPQLSPLILSWTIVFFPQTTGAFASFSAVLQAISFLHSLLHGDCYRYGQRPEWSVGDGLNGPTRLPCLMRSRTDHMNGMTLSGHCWWITSCSLLILDMPLKDMLNSLKFCSLQIPNFSDMKFFLRKNNKLFERSLHF